MNGDSVTKRPGEQVEEYLNEYFKKHLLKENDRLPSSRKLAAELKVSDSTVRNIMRKWEKEGRLHIVHGSGIYIAQQSQNRSIKIGANMDVSEHPELKEKSWGSLILSDAFQAVFKMGPKISLHSIFAAEENEIKFSSKEIEDRCKDFDGIIHYHGGYAEKELAKFCMAFKKPCVFLNMPFDQPEDVMNYVSPGNFDANLKLGSIFSKCGRKKIVLFSNTEIQRAASVRQRFAGLACGIGAALCRSVDLRMVHCNSFLKEGGYQTFKNLVENEKYRPDAVICSGDHIAMGVVEAAKELGCDVPQDLSVIGGSGISPAAMAQQISTLVHPITEMGYALIKMITQMIEKNVLQMPSKILPVEFRPGKTTTQLESELLEEAFQ